MPRTAKAVALSEVERATLEQMARHPPKWRSRLRAQTVLLLGAGLPLVEGASRQGIDKEPVAFHRDAWLERGWVGLRDLPRDGRLRQWLLAEETSLCAWAANEALTARDWQSCLAAAHEKQVSVAVIKAALVRHGFVWKRHKAKETSGLLEVLKENGLVLYFLPPYSPELNRIERFWHKMKYELMAFKHRTTEALEVAVDKALAGFGIEYQLTFCSAFTTRYRLTPNPFSWGRFQESSHANSCRPFPPRKSQPAQYRWHP